MLDLKIYMVFGFVPLILLYKENRNVTQPLVYDFSQLYVELNHQFMYNG